MPNSLSYLHSSDRSISNVRGVRYVFIITTFIEITVINANGVDPGQMPRFAASDLGLHCLPMFFSGTLGLNELTLVLLNK